MPRLKRKFQFKCNQNIAFVQSDKRTRLVQMGGHELLGKNRDYCENEAFV